MSAGQFDSHVQAYLRAKRNRQRPIDRWISAGLARQAYGFQWRAGA